MGVVAMSSTQAKAEQYAQAVGRPLGEVMSVREVSATSTPPQALEYRAVADAALSSVPIKAGTDDLSVTVSVVWSFA